MDNSNEILKEKSVHANKSEFFVFLPNDLNQIKSRNLGKENKNFDAAIAAKDEGNIHFQNKRYDAAIGMYNVAIEQFESGETLCNVELAACYQNRAAAKQYNRNYDGSILDASKAIELNEHYSKAFFRRANAYNEQRKYYRALQDIVQACVLERFRNKTYTDMVGALLTRVDSDPPGLQWSVAYSEMEADELHCDHCISNQVRFIKNCGILDPMCVPIPNNNQPPIGYIKAMVGLKEFNVDKIMAGCKEEEAMKGDYLAYSFIVRAYMNTVAITSPSNLRREYPIDMRRINELIRDEKTPENIKFNALLCRANMYHRQFKFKEANSDLKSLEENYKNNPLVYLIKSGALMQFAQNKPEFMEPLKKCCALLPNLYELHMQRAMAEVMRSESAIIRTATRITKFEQLINRFPNEIEPRVCLAGIYAKLGETQKAKKLLKRAERELPNHPNELCVVYGMLKPKHSSCVAYFKRALEFNKDDPGALKLLLDYFDSTTFEYSKAIEVSTKALYSFLQVFDFQEIFKHRQALLKRIVRQDYWDQL